MSRKDRSQPSNTQTRNSLVAAAVGVLVLVALAATFMYERDETPSAQTGVDERSAALESALSPTIGPPNAKVHIIEFLDPACETCAMFYPMVKSWMKEVPDQIRLTVRHVAFHAGSEHAVKILEASRKQDKYWQTLETLLASQSRWAINHTVRPELAMQAVAGVGLDTGQLMADMRAPEIDERIRRDRMDAMTVKVTATPEYYVNGRPLPSFGEQQLRGLIREELRRAY
jgi:protein-disulfide isomerase